MTVTPSDADARFDRTVDRWFRDQLALRPEYATFFGIHDHDADLSSGGRDAVDEEIAFYRRTVDEMSAHRPDRAERRTRAGSRPRHPPGSPWAVLADRVPALGRILGRSRAHRRGALPALHARLRAAARAAGEHRRPARGRTAVPRSETRERGHRSGAAVGRDRHRVDGAAARLPGHHRRRGALRRRRRPRWPTAWTRRRRDEGGA